MFPRTDLLAAAPARDPSAVAIGDIEHEVALREAAGTAVTTGLDGCGAPADTSGPFRSSRRQESC